MSEETDAAPVEADEAPSDTEELVPEGAWFAPSRWLVTAVAVLVVSIGGVIEVPGIDPERVQQFVPGVTAMPVVAVSAWLVIFRALRAWLRVPSAAIERGLFVTYLLAVFSSSWWTADQLEAIQQGYMGVIIEPGFQFHLVAAFTQTAGAALVWQLATWVSNKGIGSGPLVLFAAAHLRSAITGAFSEGQMFAFGLGWPVDSLSVAIGLSGILVLLAWRSPRWPVKLGSFTVRSPIDLLTLPGFAYILTSQVVETGPNGPLSTAAVLCAAPATLIIVGNWLQEAEGDRNSLAAFFALLPPAATAVLLFIGFVAAGGMRDLMEPGPFDGNNDLIVRLSVAGGTSDDQTRIGERLDVLRVEHRLRSEAGQLVIELDDVTRPGELLDLVTPRYVLGMHPVFETHEPPPPNAQVVQDCSYGPCQPMSVGPVEMVNADIADAGVVSDQYTGQPLVMLTFTAAGRQRFADLSTRLVGKRFAIVLDGQVLSAPTIQEPITGGRAQIVMGSYSANPKAEAQALAVALRSEPLAGTYTVLTVDPR